MIVKTKTFKSGNSQALRLPKEFRLNSKNVYIKKIGKGILLVEESDDFWENWWGSFEKAELIREQGSQEREELF
ncbi:antitoxin [Hippea jasoniae]|uniref:antitoxin n=1 Tax=Hippea jasoniae TaxID=944479 RepID=UPI000555FF39|nr:AbrB/MazE/SpoVT family DNA-binding domain-containing protein [Hippea jasoniae]